VGNGKCKSATFCSQLSYNNTICLSDHNSDSIKNNGPCFSDVDGDNKCKSATICSQLSYDNSVCVGNHDSDSVGNNGPCTWIKVFLLFYLFI
jgi:hypothetical protein